MEQSKQAVKFTTNHQVIEVTGLAESLDRIQPYTTVDDKGNQATCAGYLAGVEPGSDVTPQMCKSVVHFQHAYEYLVFEPKNRSASA